MVYEIDELIAEERKNYINNVLSNYQKANPSATQEEIISVRNKARIEYNKKAVQEIAPDNRIPDDVKDIIKASLLLEDLHRAVIWPIISSLAAFFIASLRLPY